MADPIPFIAQTTGEADDAPAGAIPIALYGADLQAALDALEARVEALENA